MATTKTLAPFAAHSLHGPTMLFESDKNCETFLTLTVTQEYIASAANLRDVYRDLVRRFVVGWNKLVATGVAYVFAKLAECAFVLSESVAFLTQRFVVEGVFTV